MIHYKFIRLSGNGKVRNPYRAIGNAMDRHASIGAYAETGAATRRKVLSITRESMDSPVFVLKPLEGPNVGKAEHHIPVGAVIEADVDVEAMHEDRGGQTGREPAGKASDRKDAGGATSAPAGGPVWTRGRSGGRGQPSGGADDGARKGGGSVQLPPDELEDD